MAICLADLTNSTDFVCKRNFYCMPGVVDIFDHFSNFQSGENRVAFENVSVNINDGLTGFFGVAADNCFRRCEKIINRGSFTKEFRMKTN